MSRVFDVPEGGERDRARAEGRRRRPSPMDEHLVSLRAPSSFGAEAYRTLRYIIEERHREADLQVVAVTSPAVGDGKTTTAINLAGSLAQNPDARVLLVDADIRRGAVAEHLGLDSSSVGLVGAIVDARFVLDDVVRHFSEFNLSVLTAGRSPSTPYEVLKSPRLGELLAEARRQYNYVVLDTPPLIPVPDSRVIANWVDGFLMIVAAHKTPSRLLADALDIMDPGKMLGLVFNRDDRPLSGYYHAYAQYYSAPQADVGQAHDRPRKWWRGIAREAGASLWPWRSSGHR